MNFRVAVADDEPLARTMVAELARQDPDVIEVSECGDGRRLLDLVSRNHPDIIFVDVEMPGADGLQVARTLKPTEIAVVFVTAFGQYAAAAFDAAAVDYLLKPFSDTRFRESLARAKKRVREQRIGELASRTAAIVGSATAVADVQGNNQYLQHIPIRDQGRTLVVRASDIVWIEAEDYCVVVHDSRGRRHLLRASLASLEDRLDPCTFVRVHRTAIVNVKHVKYMQVSEGLELSMSDGSTVPVSRAKRSHVHSILAPSLRR